MYSWERRRISDEELRERCTAAITKEQTKNHLFFELKAEEIAIGSRRLDKIWDECRGPIRANRRWW